MFTTGKYKPGDENNPKRRPRAWLTTVDIYKKNGVRALYVGLVPMLWRSVTNNEYLITKVTMNKVQNTLSH